MIGRRRHRAVICQRVVEMVTDYMEWTLDLGGRAAVEDHLQQCAGCTSYLRQMRRMLALTAGIAGERSTFPADVLDMLTLSYQRGH